MCLYKHSFRCLDMAPILDVFQRGPGSVPLNYALAQHCLSKAQYKHRRSCTVPYCVKIDFWLTWAYLASSKPGLVFLCTRACGSVAPLLAPPAAAWLIIHSANCQTAVSRLAVIVESACRDEHDYLLQPFSSCSPYRLALVILTCTADPHSSAVAIHFLRMML